MRNIDYNNRQFRGKVNSDNGEVSSQTLFTYYQKGNRLWGEYSGGLIQTGHLQGRVLENGCLEFLYHHENTQGELMAGYCYSTPSITADGKIVLSESWRWFTGECTSGQSVIEEVLI